MRATRKPAGGIINKKLLIGILLVVLTSAADALEISTPQVALQDVATTIIVSGIEPGVTVSLCLLYTSDAADE